MSEFTRPDRCVFLCNDMFRLHLLRLLFTSKYKIFLWIQSTPRVYYFFFSTRNVIENSLSLGGRYLVCVVTETIHDWIQFNTHTHTRTVWCCCRYRVHAYIHRPTTDQRAITITHFVLFALSFPPPFVGRNDRRKKNRKESNGKRCFRFNWHSCGCVCCFSSFFLSLY